MKNLLKNYHDYLISLVASDKASDIIGFFALSSLFTLPIAYILFAYIVPFFWYVVGLFIKL